MVGVGDLRGGGGGGGEGSHDISLTLADCPITSVVSPAGHNRVYRILTEVHYYCHSFYPEMSAVCGWFWFSLSSEC